MASYDDDDSAIVPTDIESSHSEEPDPEALEDGVSGEASEIPALNDEAPPEAEPSEAEPQEEPIEISDSQVYGDDWVPPHPYPAEAYPNHEAFWTDSQPPEAESPSEYDKYTVEDKKQPFQPEVPTEPPSVAVPERHLNPECEERVKHLKSQIANLRKQRSSLFLVRNYIYVSFLSLLYPEPFLPA